MTTNFSRPAFHLQIIANGVRQFELQNSDFGRLLQLQQRSFARAERRKTERPTAEDDPKPDSKTRGPVERRKPAAQPAANSGRSPRNSARMLGRCIPNVAQPQSPASSSSGAARLGPPPPDGSGATRRLLRAAQARRPAAGSPPALFAVTSWLFRAHGRGSLRVTRCHGGAGCAIH